MYALQLTERQYLTRDNTKWNDNTFIDYYSPRDFEQFKRYKAGAWYAEVEIIHDPTLPVDKEAETNAPNKGGRPRKTETT